MRTDFYKELLSPLAQEGVTPNVLIELGEGPNFGMKTVLNKVAQFTMVKKYHWVEVSVRVFAKKTYTHLVYTNDESVKVYVQPTYQDDHISGFFISDLGEGVYHLLRRTGIYSPTYLFAKLPKLQAVELDDIFALLEMKASGHLSTFIKKEFVGEYLCKTLATAWKISRLHLDKRFINELDSV